MKNIVLDFTGCKYIDEIYEIIKKEFKFPDFFGKNPDALWDCLKEYAHPPLHVCIFGYDTLSREFQVYMEDIFKIFNYLNDCSPDITFEIISKTLSFSSFKKDQRNSLGKNI